MRPLTTAELFQVWETGLDQSMASRALTLLQAANPELDGRALAALSVGERDGLLLTLREWTFGARLTALAACPQCQEQVEFEFEAKSIRAPALLPANPAAAERQPSGDGQPAQFQTVVAAAGGDPDRQNPVEVSFRLPTAADMVALAGAGVSAGIEPRTWLLQHCILSAASEGQLLPVTELPQAVIEAVVARMAELDEQAAVELALTCPSCGRQWAETFDILAYFWSEIQRWAQQILVAIHTLARAYGWREADILALSPRRRQIYMQMVTT